MRRGVNSVRVCDLDPGDKIVLKTANSVYEFWVEYPDRNIGVFRGGHGRRPMRVWLAPESASSSDGDVGALTVGDRARAIQLGPEGQPERAFVTSRIAAIGVLRSRSAVA